MNPFKTHKNLQECWQTSDGQCFYTDNAAKNHAKTLEDKRVKHLTRDKYQDTDETPEAGKPENIINVPIGFFKEKTEDTESNTDAGKPENIITITEAGPEAGKPENTNPNTEAGSEGSDLANKLTEADLRKMKRTELDEVAASLGLETKELPNMNAVIEAILADTAEKPSNEPANA